MEKPRESLDSVRVIPLTQGQFTIVDADDYEWLSKWKWTVWHTKQGGFYARAWVSKQTSLAMHRIILNAGPGQIVDHINRNTLDNRRANLRIVTQSQSNCNRRLLIASNKSGFRGVHWNSKAKKWRAFIGINKRLIYLGSFDTPKAAAIARDEASRKYHGGFSPLNLSQ